jgi:hypothetical protein
VLNTADGWYPAIDSSGGATREGAWVAETHQTGGSVEMVDRHPAEPIRFGPNGCFRRKGDACVLTARTMRRPNVLEDFTLSRSLTAPEAITL